MVRVYHLHFKKFSPNVKFFLIGNALQGIGLSVYSLLFNLYLKEIGFGESVIGNLISTSSLGISLMALPASFVIDKFHVKHLVVTGLFLSSIFYFLQVLSINQGQIFAFGLLASMFQALFNISLSPFFLRNSGPEERVYLFSLNSSLSMGAHLVGYLLGGFLPQVLNLIKADFSQLEVYRLSIMLALGLVISSNLVFLKIKKVPIPRVKKSILKELKEKEWRILCKLILPKLCFAFGGGLIVPFMNLYLHKKFSLSTQMVGFSYAFLQLMIFMGIFITPTIIRKTTQLKFILLTGILSVPFMITMGLTANITLVLSCFFMRGMLMNMSSPITSIFEMEKVREQECVFASATIMFFYHIVYTFSTRLGGYLIENFSFSQTFYLSATFYGFAIILYYKFFNQSDKDHQSCNFSIKDVA